MDKRENIMFQDFIGTMVGLAIQSCVENYFYKKRRSRENKNIKVGPSFSEKRMWVKLTRLPRFK